MKLESILNSAIGTGEIITIIYSGGSKPGTKRDISPILIKDGKVRARCLSSNAVKQFMLNKIKIVNYGESGADNWENVEEQNAKEDDNLSGVYETYNVKFKKLGWYVFLEENTFSLHRKQKIADKPLKASSVSIDYNEYTSDYVMGSDGGIREENVRKSTRPYTLRANGKTTKTYGYLSRAIPQLVIWAEELSPIK